MGDVIPRIPLRSDLRHAAPGVDVVPAPWDVQADVQVVSVGTNLVAANLMARIAQKAGGTYHHVDATDREATLRMAFVHVVRVLKTTIPAGASMMNVSDGGSTPEPAGRPVTIAILADETVVRSEL